MFWGKKIKSLVVMQGRCSQSLDPGGWAGGWENGWGVGLSVNGQLVL